jgi:hypothetical protein
MTGQRDDTIETMSGIEEVRRVGLCADCRHARRVKSARGSDFWLCALASIDPRFPKYPQLPVLECGGHEPQSTKPLSERTD